MKYLSFVFLFTLCAQVQADIHSDLSQCAQISDNTQKMLDFSVERASEALTAAGAYDLMIDSPIPHGGWHLLGTARMGADPAHSVVNEWGRSHDVKNLFVVDGSIFVTSAGVNPTRTIQTLSLYITDQIKKRLSNLFD